MNDKTGTARTDHVRDAVTIDGVLQHPSTLLRRAASLWPQSIALVCEEESITFCALHAQAVAIGHEMRKRGVKPNDRVLLLFENSINFYRAYHAAWMIGAVVAPLNVFLQKHELEHIVADAQPVLMVVSKTLESKVQDIAFSAHNGPAAQVWVTDFSDYAHAEILPCDDVSSGDHRAPDHQPMDTCTVLLYTSGTTGMPKGVMLSGINIMTNCLQAISQTKITSQERVYAALPLFHCYMQNVCVWCALLLGALVIVIPKITRKTLVAGLAHNPTFVLGIPQLYGLFCLMKNLDFSHVKLFVSGGDALHSATRMYFALLYGRKIANGYGLTETSPLISVHLEDCIAPTHAVGKPMEGIFVQMRDETGAVVPHGQIGTIWVKGDNVMLGYYNAPEATHAVVVDGWLNTGDLGYCDDRGNIVLTGRARDLIVNKGVKIYPQEVENVLVSHPAVTMAAVVGMRDGDDEYPVAFVAAAQGTAEEQDVLARELKQLCAQRIALYKVPRAFFVRKALPLTATGKVDKKVLRAELAQKASNS